MNIILLSLLVDSCDEENPALYGPLRAGFVSSAGSDVRVADAVISVLVAIATAIVVKSTTFAACCGLFHLKCSSVICRRYIN